MLVAYDGQVVRNTLHGDGGIPGPLQFAVGRTLTLHASAERHRLRIFRARYLPRISVLQPVVRLLDLLPVDDPLAENAVVVADAVSHGGEIKRGHRIEIACSQTTQTSISKARIRLEIAQIVPVYPVGAKRIATELVGLKVYHIVSEQAADEKLERKIIDILGVLLVVLGLSIHPTLRDAVSYGIRKSKIAVTSRGGILAFRQRVPKMVRIISLKPRNAHFDASSPHFPVIHSF